jgi:hypothetical protein
MCKDGPRGKSAGRQGRGRGVTSRDLIAVSRGQYLIDFFRKNEVPCRNSLHHSHFLPQKSQDILYE